MRHRVYYCGTRVRYLNVHMTCLGSVGGDLVFEEEYGNEVDVANHPEGCPAFPMGESAK